MQTTDQPARPGGGFGDLPPNANAVASKAALSPQAGELVGRKRSAIIKWIHTRGLPATKLPSGQYLIPRDKFTTWLEEKGVKLPLNPGN